MTKSNRLRAKVGRDALLGAAADLFLEQGFAATSIDAIIERAGGSKRNIYTEFGNKEGLFAAIVSEHAERALSALSFEKAGPQDLRETLAAFGGQLMDIYMSPTLLGIYRIAVTDHARFPALVRKFYALGPGLATARLAEVLETARQRGEISVTDCSAAADHFVGMVRGNLHLQVVLGLRPPPDEEEARASVHSIVGIFLDGVCAVVGD